MFLSHTHNSAWLKQLGVNDPDSKSGSSVIWLDTKAGAGRRGWWTSLTTLEAGAGRWVLLDKRFSLLMVIYKLYYLQKRLKMTWRHVGLWGVHWPKKVVKVQLPMTSPLALFFHWRRERVCSTPIFWVNITPQRTVLHKGFVTGYKKCIYFSCVLLVDKCNTTTIKYHW